MPRTGITLIITDGVTERQFVHSNRAITIVHDRRMIILVVKIEPTNDVEAPVEEVLREKAERADLVDEPPGKPPARCDVTPALRATAVIVRRPS